MFIRRIFFLLLLSFIWSLLLFHYLSYDYGLYYVQSINLDNNIKLYRDIFDTKGPAYYFFINFLSKIIGSGILQSYISLSLTTFIFFFTIYFIFYQKNKKDFLLIFLFCVSIFHQQNLNISLSLFQMSFQLLSFYFLLKCNEQQSDLGFFYSIIFFSLSCFTRKDGLIYLPVYLLFLFFLPNLRDKIRYFIIIIGTFLICFLFFKLYFEFTFQDFWIHNFSVNTQQNWDLLWNREPFIKVFNSPYHVYLLMFTGIGPIFFDIFSKKIKQSTTNIKGLTTLFEQNRIIIFEVSIILCGIFGWLYAGTDKNYHGFILFLPLIFFICFNSNLLAELYIKKYFYYLLCGFFFLITLYPDTKNVVVNKCWSLSLNCKNKVYLQITDELKKAKKHGINKDLFIIGGDGWIYLYSKNKINKSISSDLFYFTSSINNKKKDFKFPNSINRIHNSLINKDNGFIFWVNKSLIRMNNNNDSPIILSKKFNDVLAISKRVTEIDNFIKFQIVKK